MITLEQAIELATKAHEGQWRKPRLITDKEFKDNFSLIEQSVNLEENFILDNGYKVIITEPKHIFIEEPYIIHPLAVMEMMDRDEEKIVAILHDVFEKCPGWCLGRVMDDSKFYIKYQPENVKYITTANVYWALTLISKDKHVKYNDYIYNMIHAIKLDGTPNKLAIKVKLADIFHNLSDNPSKHAKEKYLKALPILLKSL